MTVGLLMFKDNCLNVFHDMLGGGMRERKERREIESFKIIIEISMQYRAKLKIKKTPQIY